MKYLTILLLLLHSPLKSMTFHTIANGYWNDTMVWAGHVVPPNSMSDTFIISDSILLDSGLVFNHCYVLIDSSGGLCGHYTVSFINGSLWNNYGSTCNVQDSAVNLAGNQGGSGVPTFIANYDYSNSIANCSDEGIPNNTSNTYSISLYPNPNNGTFTLHSQLSILNCQLKVMDVLGRTVYSYSIDNLSIINCQLSIESGIYFWEVMNDSGILANGKLAVIK